MLLVQICSSLYVLLCSALTDCSALVVLFKVTIGIQKGGWNTGHHWQFPRQKGRTGHLLFGSQEARAKRKMSRRGRRGQQGHGRGGQIHAVQGFPDIDIDNAPHVFRGIPLTRAVPAQQDDRRLS